MAEQHEPRYLRRMSAVLLQTFRQACSEGETELARSLIISLETVLLRAVGTDEEQDRAMLLILSAHRDLWNVRHGLSYTSEIVAAPRGRPPKNARRSPN